MSAALQAAGVALQADALVALRQIALQAQNDPILSIHPGGFAGKRKGQGQEVADLREYHAGDDIRHLDRGATARTGRLFVRQFREERDRVSLLVADFRAPMIWGISRALLSVVAAEVLGLLGWNRVEDGGRVGLLAITPGDPVYVTPRGRARGQLAVIGGLVKAHEQALQAVAAGSGPGVDLSAALANLERLAPVGSEILIASGFDAMGDEFAQTLNRIDRRRSTRLIGLTDAQSLPQGRYPVRLSDGRRLRLNLAETGSDLGDVQIADHPVLQLNAADPVEVLARQLAAAFHQERRI